MERIGKVGEKGLDSLKVWHRARELCEPSPMRPVACSMATSPTSKNASKAKLSLAANLPPLTLISTTTNHRRNNTVLPQRLSA